MSLLLYKLVYFYILHTVKVMYDAIVPMKGTNQMLVHGIATIASMNISPWLLHSMELALGCVLCCTLNCPLIIMLFPFATLPASPHLPSSLHLLHSLLNYATVAQTHRAKTWNPSISYLQGWLYNSFSANNIQLCNWVTLYSYCYTLQIITKDCYSCSYSYKYNCLKATACKGKDKEPNNRNNGCSHFVSYIAS